MAVLDFPANPVLNQEYNFPPFRYRWDGEKWRTIGTGANPVQTQIAEHRVEKDAHAIETITNLREELSALGGTPVLSVVWVQRRDAMWPGYVPADGQTLARADYADAYQAIAGGKVPVVADSEWVSDTWKRGCFTEGDGSSTFRIPDYNGKFAGSMGAVFLRGDGQNSGVTNGYIQDSGIKSHDANTYYPDGRPVSLNSSSVPNNGLRLPFDNMALDPNKSELVAKYVGENETRPINVTGCWAIKLAGAAQNSGQIDALALATQMANKLDKTTGGTVLEHTRFKKEVTSEKFVACERDNKSIGLEIGVTGAPFISINRSMVALEFDPGLTGAMGLSPGKTYGVDRSRTGAVDIWNQFHAGGHVAFTYGINAGLGAFCINNSNGAWGWISTVATFGSNGDQQLGGAGYAQRGWHTGSDINFKEDVQPLKTTRQSWIDKVCSLGASTFTYKSDGRKAMGFVAQTVRNVIPEAVSVQKINRPGATVNTDMVERLFIDPMAIIAAQNEAIKEMAERLRKLEEKL